MNTFIAGQLENQGYYSCFKPNPINREWAIEDMRIISLLSKADRILGRLDMFSNYVPNIDMFIRMHVVKEATKSSNIEGTQTDIEEALQSHEDVPLDKRDDRSEVQNYIDAMNFAINELSALPLSSRLIRMVHEHLMRGVRGEHKQPGEFRRSQNWIGGRTPSDAVFVPPVHLDIPELMGDIESFIHSPVCDLPDLIKIAIIHYQFETIHPFNDGNGRTGRLLITLYLVSKGILQRPILYLSDFLEKHRRSYYDKIMAVRTENKIGDWVAFFLEGVIETAHNGTRTLSDILDLQREYSDLIRPLGARAVNARKLINAMYSNPYIDGLGAAKILEVTPPTAYALLRDMSKSGIIKEVMNSGRERKYVLDKYLKIFKG